jgi:hypothetical protein
MPPRAGALHGPHASQLDHNERWACRTARHVRWRAASRLCTHTPEGANDVKRGRRATIHQLLQWLGLNSTRATLASHQHQVHLFAGIFNNKHGFVAVFADTTPVCGALNLSSAM